MFIQILYLFFIWVVSCWLSSLYVLYIKSLLDIWFTHIFTYFKSCLFTVVVSFDTQKFFFFFFYEVQFLFFLLLPRFLSFFRVLALMFRSLIYYDLIFVLWYKIGLFYMALIMLRSVPSMPTFWRVFIINRSWILSKASSSSEMIIWFLSFNLLCCIPGINPTWSWCMIFLMYWVFVL